MQPSIFQLPRPLFFPSVSSVKTMLPPVEYLNVLTHLRDIYPYFLVSAYDLTYPKGEANSMNSILDATIKLGNTILLDSGNYESYWKSSDWNQKDFHKILDNFSYSMAFSFDNQYPSKIFNQHFKELIANYERDKKFSKDRLLIPIIHGSKDVISDLCKRIAIETKSPMIAVPERSLGYGLIERAKTVEKIRLSLDSNECYTRLHLLGTGNPISLAVYTLMGADSFDGLEWCQTVVDYDTAYLFHFSQAEFFFDNNDLKDVELPYILKTLTHNLIFYSKWMKGLQDSLMAGTLVEFCQSRFSPKIYKFCYENLEWGKLL